MTASHTLLEEQATPSQAHSVRGFGRSASSDSVLSP
jgi:hypothetical protein